jgi:hypothetical protein
MPRLLVRVAATVAFVVALFAPRLAHAQIHMDASLQGGVMKRFIGNRAPGSDDAGFGPTAELNAHVALLPLIRIGAYVGHDISPVSGDQSPTRDLTWFGLRAKVMPPFPGDFKPYAFAGFGYAIVYQRSYHTTANIPTGIGDDTKPFPATVQGAGGSFFDVPLGVGMEYKLAGPIALCAELTAHIGFGWTGSVYDDNPPDSPGPQLSVAGMPDNNAQPIGNDAIGLGLTVGLMLDL